MKFLKWLVVALVVIIALLFAVSFVLPSRVHVERSMSMAAPPEKVFAQVGDLKKWPTWSPWNLRDPEMKVQYEGPAQGAGQKSVWQSKSQGDGSQLITAITPNSALETQLDFGDQGTATSFWKFSKEGEGTRVTWGMDVVLDSPLQRLFGVVMEGMIGPDYEEGLANLKSIVEAKP
ncbi:MAG: SRPBCC family protein [Verrucomicrobiales bacterium]